VKSVQFTHEEQPCLQSLCCPLCVVLLSACYISICNINNYETKSLAIPFSHVLVIQFDNLGASRITSSYVYRAWGGFESYVIRTVTVRVYFYFYRKDQPEWWWVYMVAVSHKHVQGEIGCPKSNSRKQSCACISLSRSTKN